MRTTFVAFAALCALPLSAEAQVPVDRRAAASADGAVRIQSMAGSVRVTGWAHDSIAVTGTVPDPALGQFVFSVGEGGAKLGVWETGAKPAEAHLEVHVPARSTIWIKTAGAEVRVEGVTGSIDAYAVSGDVTIGGAPREIVAESLAGDVSIVADSRSVRAKSATGSVTLRGAVTDATATTVSGPLHIDGSALVSGRFESVDGDITWRGMLGARSTLDFVNHAGDVRFELPADAAAEIIVDTYEGRLDNRLGASVQQGGSSLKGRRFHIRVGGDSPGGQVSVRTFKGNVALHPSGG